MIIQKKKKITRELTTSIKVCDVCKEEIVHKKGNRVVFAYTKKAEIGIHNRKQWGCNTWECKDYHYHEKCFLGMLNKKEVK